MDNLQDGIQQLLGLGPEALTIIGVIVLGYFLRFLPFIPNKAIPAICIAVSTILYPLMVVPKAVEGSRNPMVRLAIIGMVLGTLAWIFHNKALKKIEDKCGLFTKTGETQLITKPPDTQPPKP